MNSKHKLNAFTLAEVLITLGIIGVVAAVSMPILIQNVNERVNAEREANIAFKINQAMEKMRALGLLNASYGTTEAFVDELQNHLKIAKRCDSAHIAECWPTSTVIDTTGEEYDVSDAKTGKDLQFKDRTTNNVGIVLADGAALILNYDQNAPTFDVGDAISASKDAVGGKFYTTNLTAGLAYVTDVNGRKGPNSQEEGKRNDIRSFNGAKFGTGCAGVKTNNGTCVFQVQSAGYVNCADTSGEDYSYCSPTPSGRTNDYWAGAKKACESMDMKLPTFDELVNLMKNETWDSKSLNYYWSSTEYSYNPIDYASVVSGNGRNTGGENKSSSVREVVCVGK